MGAPDVSLVIVNYNAGRHLAACLASVGDALAGVDWQAIVVDNASSDGSGGAVAQCAPRATLVEAGTNLGFARAANLGASHASAPLLLFLNPDCRLRSNPLPPLLDELAAYPRCAVVAPTVADEDGTPQGNARGDPDMLTGLFGRTSTLRRVLPGTALSRRNVVAARHDEPPGRSLEVDWVSGSCMLVRRDAFGEVGGFDGRYFLYWEDADLCRRLRGAGWTTRFRPDATVIHVGGQSARSAPGLALRAFHRSAFLYYRTHVAPSPLDPRRGIAALLLALRYGTKRIERALSRR